MRKVGYTMNRIMQTLQNVDHTKQQALLQMRKVGYFLHKTTSIVRKVGYTQY